MYKDGSQMDLRRKKGDTVTIIVPPAKDLDRQHPSLYGALSFFFFSMRLKLLTEIIQTVRILLTLKATCWFYTQFPLVH